METYYAGIDLHSSNNYIGIINAQDQRIYSKRHSNNMNEVLMALSPFKKQIESVVVESTYNWYWLVDGLQNNGYNVRLANPSAVKQYEGLKHVDDKWDAFWLAHMKRLDILPEGYIYPKEHRPLRDLLRRRLLFVKHRTANILSFQSMITRHLGSKMSLRVLEKLRKEELEEMFKSKHLVMMAQNYIDVMQFLKVVIKRTEKEILSQVELRKDFEMLLTIPGIGNILGITIMLEVGDINRFPKVGNYSSYCRCVKSEKFSDGKKKGNNNKKNGNKYLAWAYVEAANFMIRHCPEAHRYYQKKKANKNGIVAIKSLSNKIARASYYIMRDRVSFDVNKLFKK